MLLIGTYGLIIALGLFVLLNYPLCPFKIPVGNNYLHSTGWPETPSPVTDDLVLQYRFNTLYFQKIFHHLCLKQGPVVDFKESHQDEFLTEAPATR